MTAATDATAPHDHDPLDVKEVWAAIHAKHPHFVEAVMADAKVTAAYRGERNQFRSKVDAVGQIIRLMWMCDGFAAHVAYRAKCSLQRRHVPLLPRLLHKFMMASAQLSIGDPVVIAAGVYIAHGQSIIDGLVEIGPGCVIAPWTSIGLVPGNVQGPTIEAGCFIGTGSKLLGPHHIGAHTFLGANSVVTGDIPAGVVAVGAPCKPIGPSPTAKAWAEAVEAAKNGQADATLTDPAPAA